MTIQKPKALKPGDTIAVISPSAPTIDPPDAFDRGLALLEAAGYRPLLMPHARHQGPYLAGSDEDRLQDLHAAFADPEVHAVLCARGGYGCMRLLAAVDFEMVADHPKIFIGFSDITALLLPFYQRCNLIGFYGPMLTSNLITDDPFSQDTLLALLGGGYNLPMTVPNRDAYHCFQPGVAEGRLIGGNLSLLAALCGTPFQPETDGHILFIEDWKEQEYSLDRQFRQLEMAGLFDGIAGLLLCDFSHISLAADLTLPGLLQSLTSRYGVPCGYGFSVGHGNVTATLPIGCMARFDAATGKVALLEKPVQ